MQLELSNIKKSFGEGDSKIEVLKDINLSVDEGEFVVISLLITYPMITCLMVRIFRIMLKEMMSGWLIIWLDPKVYYKMFLLGIVSYALVAVLEYFKISRIPMEEALKNIE